MPDIQIGDDRLYQVDALTCRIAFALAKALGHPEAVRRIESTYGATQERVPLRPRVTTYSAGLNNYGTLVISMAKPNGETFDFAGHPDKIAQAMPECPPDVAKKYELMWKDEHTPATLQEGR